MYAEASIATTMSATVRAAAVEPMPFSLVLIFGKGRRTMKYSALRIILYCGIVTTVWYRIMSPNCKVT
jgi:hypothetical protein